MAATNMQATGDYQNPYDDEAMRRLLAQQTAAAPRTDIPQQPRGMLPVKPDASTNPITIAGGGAGTTDTHNPVDHPTLPTPAPEPHTPTAYQPQPANATSLYGADTAAPTMGTTDARTRLPAPTDPTTAPPGTTPPPGTNPNPNLPVNTGPPITPNSPLPANPNTGGTVGDNADFGQAGNITSWFKQHGVTLRPGAEQTWMGYWNDWGKANPSYFLQRLNQAVTSGSEQGSTDTTAGAGGGGYQSQYDQQIHDYITKMLQHASQPVTGDDPSIRAQFNPQDQVIQRNQARGRAAVAESQFAQGTTGPGAMDVPSAQIAQASGLDEASLMGNLIGNELTARRQEAVQALQLAQGQDKIALDGYIANLDAELRKYGMNQQNQQFYDQMGVGIGNKEADYNQNLLQILAQYNH